MSDLEPLVKALQRKLQAQAEQIDSLEDRVAELEQLVDPDPGTVEYDQLKKSQKVHRVRTHLLTLATNGGRMSMHYDGVKALFDGHPSDGHCYELMKQAANIEGFVYETGGHGRGQKRLRVKPDAVNDERVLHAVNNTPDATPA